AFSASATTITYAQFSSEGGVASDNCQIASITYQDMAGGSCPITVTRTFVVRDGANNSASCQQIITIHDQTAPTISCAGPVTVSCTSLVPAADASSVTASDNCGGTPTVVFVSDATSSQTCANRYTITRTYKASDACGNTAACTQTITVDD